MRKPIIVGAVGAAVGAWIGAFLGLVVGVIVSLILAVVGWFACILAFYNAEECITFATEVFKFGAVSVLLIGTIWGLLTGIVFASIVYHLKKSE